MGMKFKLNLKCAACGAINNSVNYMPLNADEHFTCTKCKAKNLIAMSFLTILDNPDGKYTMMMKPPEKRMDV